MKKTILLNPGPVNVTPSVRRALLKPDICHREHEFSTLLQSIRTRLLKIFSVERSHTVAFFSGSGTTALEAMLCASAAEGKKVLVLSNGVYGERIQKTLQIHEISSIVLDSPIGEFPNLHLIEETLKKNPAIESVALVHHETSSGMLNPLKEVSALAKKYGKLVFVDAISSLGAETIHFKNIDYLAGTSGKCLHGFPGVSFVFIEKKALPRLKSLKVRSLSFDLWNALEHQLQNDTPFTPVVQIFYAFDQALKELEKETLSRRIRRYEEKATLLEKGFEEMGIQFLISKKNRSHVLTALWTPASVSYATLHDTLKKKGFVIYAGQSSLKGKIFRVANLGDVSIQDLRRFLAAFKKSL